MTNLAHSRSFGVELETTRLSIAQAVAALRAAGISTFDAESSTLNGEDVDSDDENTCDCATCRNDRMDRPVVTAPEVLDRRAAIKAAWKVTYDGSISNGCEIVSPILSGNEGLAEVTKVVKALRAAGAKIDRTCGFHVHVDARDLEGPELIHAVKRYAKHERDIDAFMAPIRRESRSEWCQSMVELVPSLSRGLSFNAEGVANIPQSRYYKLNLAAYVKHGTLEFRQHGGTLNLQKIKNWVVFCVNFVEDSRLSKDFLDAQKAAAEAKKFQTLGRMLAATGPNNRTSCWTLAGALGIPANKVRETVEALKVLFPEFAVVREVNDYYRAMSPIQGAQWRQESTEAVAETVEGPGIFDNLPASTVNYLRERATAYALPRAPRTTRQPRA